MGEDRRVRPRQILPSGRALAVDAAIAAGAAVLQVGGTLLAARHQSPVRVLDWAGVLLLAAAAVPLLARRRWPVPVFVATLALTLAYALLSFPYGPIFAALIVAFGNAVVLGRRWATYTVLAAGFAAFGWLVPALTPEAWPSLVGAAGLATWLLLLLAASELIRYRRALNIAEAARRDAATRVRAEEVERRAAEDRLAIARELHDVLGHSLSVINVQAGAALELFEADRAAAAAAMAAVRTASRDALLSVQGFLDSLRGPGEHAPSQPLPRLAELAGLLFPARDAGLDVRAEVLGGPRPVTAAADLAACRCIQESLTNVLRHAGRCDVRVTVVYEPAALEVRVDNAPGAGPPPAPSGGRGIDGMRERIEALGGTLRAGPDPGGGWAVAARIPTPATPGPAEESP